MPYRWNDRQDADEAVVVVMNTLDQNQEIRGWLVRTIQQAANDSDPALAEHFFKELERHRPEALRYFQKPTY
jgi:GH25 family lysozyme M1 (1,4-beta-N-acetylmuramidase)